MTFSTPEWFTILIIIPLVVTMAILTWRRRERRWKAIIAQRLKAQLARTRCAKRHFIALGLSMIGFLLIVFSLAMPENGEEFLETRQEGRNILLCFDISQSMLTLDAGAGSRLASAKGAALEIVERFPTDRIGLLVFAGESQLIVPLTIDHNFLNESITQLNPIDLPIGGSNLAQAIKDATRILNKTGQRNNTMVVLSDGEDHSSGIETAANTAAANGVFIYALGFGSENGDFVQDPRSRDGYFYDRRGNRVLSQLKEESLRRIANQTQGVYSRAAGGNFLTSLQQAVSEMDSFEEEGGHQRIAKPIYQWFLFPGLLFLVSAFILQRLPVAAPAASVIMALFAFFAPLQSEAHELVDIYHGRLANETGLHSAAHDNFKKAAEKNTGARAAKLHLAAGASAYQEKDWDTAAASFGEALLAEDESLRQKAHYALANSLFYKGREQKDENQVKTWQGAISHFEESLNFSDDTAARENLEFLKKLIQQKQQQQEQKKNDEQKKNNSEEQSEDSPKNSDKENKPEEQSENSDSDQGDKEDAENPSQSPDQEQPDSKNPEGPENPEEQEAGEGSGNQSEEEKPAEGSEKNNEQKEEESSKKNDVQESPQTQTNQEQSETEPKETSVERARRILREQADFGGKPPRARRRTYRRPEKDW